MDQQTAVLAGTIVTVLGQCILGYMAYRSKQRVEDIHVATNGMKKELEAVKFAAGVAQGEKNAADREKS